MAQEIVKSTKSLIAEANKIVETISIEEAKKIVSSEKHILM